MPSRLFTALLLVALLGTTKVSAAPTECVILLHGLARTSRSMVKLEDALREKGYAVANIDYPSRKHPIESLAPEAVGRGLEACRKGQAPKIHFVTHSLGGILVRYYLARNSVPELGRVVMLGPPNQGSEVVDRFSKVPGYAIFNGKAGYQLGTGPDSVPNMLGPVLFPVGVIAGTESVNPILSTALPDPNDGKVSVERARVEGMSDFMAVSASHPFIMRNPEAIRQALAFLKNGKFTHNAP
jgi:triacylglycerol lipase